MCAVHNIPLKPRVPYLTVERYGIELEKDEWERFVDKQHEFANKNIPTSTIWVCPKCSYAVRE